ARVEQRQRVVDHAVGVDRRPVLLRPQAAEVNVHRHPRRARCLLAQPQRLDAPARVAADLRVTLDALDEVAVLLDGVDRFPDVDPVRAIEADVTMAEPPAHEVVRDEGIDACDSRVLDELAEALDGERGGAALVDDGRDARANANLVRVHPEVAGDVLVDVAVRVDHAGDHELIPCVDGTSASTRDPRRHLRNPSVFHGDVMKTIDPGGGIDHTAAADNQVELRHCVSPRPGSANAPRSSYTTMGPARSTHHILAKVRDTVVPVSFLASRTRSAPEGVGKPVRRREDPRLVTGAGCYTDDVNLPGQAYAAMVPSPHAHARIVRIDKAAA